jgi:transposase
VCRLLVRQEDVFMVKRIDPEVRARAVRMFADHVGDYPSVTAASEAIASMVGVSRATMARWVAQVEVDQGRRPGTMTEDAEEIRRLRTENARLREDNEILRKASIFFAGELDPRNR